MIMENNNIRTRIGAQIRELREAKGLSLRELSELTGVDHNNICSIENGKYNARLDTLDKLVAVFKKTVGIIDDK